MEMLSYGLADRLFLLLCGTYIAVIAGGPYWLHHLLALDAPSRLWRGLLQASELRLNRMHRPRADRRMRGRLVTLVFTALTCAVAIAAMMVTMHTEWGWALELALLAYMIPIRQSVLPYLEMLKALKRKRKKYFCELLETHTDCDLDHVDGHTLIRVAIASLSQHLTRYVVSPSLYYLLFGVPGLMLSRLMSCMVDLFPASHQRYEAFGRSAHLWDHLQHMFPVRIAALFMWLALLFVPKANMAEALRAFTRRKGEGAITTERLPVRIVAYGLHYALAGPAHCGGVARSVPWIGEGKAKLDLGDFMRSLIWYGCSATLWLLFLTVLYALLLVPKGQLL